MKKYVLAIRTYKIRENYTYYNEKGVISMKDILKVMSTYFALGFGTIAGVGAGMKICEKLFERKDEKIIKIIKESK